MRYDLLSDSFQPDAAITAGRFAASAVDHRSGLDVRFRRAAVIGLVPISGDQ
ncbi:MAG TPA: hypothetical protein VFM48_02445 [Aquabacterium sp.]|nr:hypothetical protein [Aquabacterium sp.]